MLRPSAIKPLKDTLVALQIEEHEIVPLIGCYNAYHPSDDITVNSLDGVPFITEAGHEALVQFIDTELFSLSETERMTGVTVAKLQEMIDVCAMRNDIPADAGIRPITLNGEYVIPKGYIEHLQDRYLAFSDYISENPEENLNLTPYEEKEEKEQNDKSEKEEDTPEEDTEKSADEDEETSDDKKEKDSKDEEEKEKKKKEKEKRDKYRKELLKEEQARHEADRKNALKDEQTARALRDEEQRKLQIQKTEDARHFEEEKEKSYADRKEKLSSVFSENKQETTHYRTSDFVFSSEKREEYKAEYDRQQKAQIKSYEDAFKVVEVSNKEEFVSHMPESARKSIESDYRPHFESYKKDTYQAPKNEYRASETPYRPSYEDKKVSHSDSYKEQRETYSPSSSLYKTETAFIDTLAGRRVVVPESRREEFYQTKSVVESTKENTPEICKSARSFDTYVSRGEPDNFVKTGTVITLGNKSYFSEKASLDEANRIKDAVQYGHTITPELKDNILKFRDLDDKTVEKYARISREREKLTSVVGSSREVGTSQGDVANFFKNINNAAITTPGIAGNVSPITARNIIASYEKEKESVSSLRNTSPVLPNGAKVIGTGFSILNERQRIDSVTNDDLFRGSRVGGIGSMSSDDADHYLKRNARIVNQIVDGKVKEPKNQLVFNKDGEAVIRVGNTSYTVPRDNLRSFNEVRANGNLTKADREKLASLSSKTREMKVDDPNGPEDDKNSSTVYMRFNGQRIMNRGINVAGNMLLSPVNNSEIAQGVHRIGNTVGTVMSVVGVNNYQFRFSHDTATPLQDVRKITLTRKYDDSTSKVLAHATRTNLLASTQAMNRVFRETEGFKNLQLDASFGLSIASVNNKAIKGAKGFFTFSETNNIKLSELQNAISKVKDAGLKRELQDELKLHRFFRDRGINYGVLTNDEIAALIYSTDGDIRKILQRKSGIRGYKDGLRTENRVIRDAQGRRVRSIVTNNTITGNRKLIEKYLSSRGYKEFLQGNVSILDLRRLLNDSRVKNDEGLKYAIITLIGIRELEEGGIQRFGIGSRMYSLGMNFIQTASSNDAFAGLSDTMVLARKAGQIISTPKTVMNLGKSISSYGRQNQANRIDRKINKLADGAKKDKLTERKKKLDEKISKKKNSRQSLKDRMAETKKKQREKMLGVAKDKFGSTKFGKLFGEGISNMKQFGKRFAESGLGKALSGTAKALGKGLQHLAKLFAKIKHYILIGALIVFMLITGIQMVMYLVGFGGKTIVGIWDSIANRELGPQRLMEQLAEVQDYDNKLFGKIDEMIENNNLNLKDWGVTAYGFINANDSLKDSDGNSYSNHMNVWGALQRTKLYKADHLEQIYMSGTSSKAGENNGSEGQTVIQRYSNAKDILSMCYAAYDGSINILQDWFSSDKRYCVDIWKNSHFCYMCEENMDADSLHGHTDKLSVCAGGDGTYTYYCNLNTASGAQQGTQWVYGAALYKSQTVISDAAFGASATKDVYLAVTDGDTAFSGKQSAQLFGRDFGDNHNGKGCIEEICHGTTSIVPYALTYNGVKFEKDTSGKNIGYRDLVRPDGSSCDNHSSVYYCSDISQCNNRFNITHSPSQLSSCWNVYYCHKGAECSNHSTGTGTRTTYHTAVEKTKEVKVTVKVGFIKIPVKIPVKYMEVEGCDNTEKTNERKTVTYNGQVIPLDEPIYDVVCKGHEEKTTEYTCLGHCSGHDVCGGHIKCLKHYRCDGHTMSYCVGHTPVTVYVQINGIYDDEFFNKDVTDKDISKEQRQYAEQVYEEDWNTLYGIKFSTPGTTFAGLSESEKTYCLRAIEPFEISDRARALSELAFDSIGKIPYYGKCSEYFNKYNGGKNCASAYYRTATTDEFFQQFLQIAKTPDGRLADEKGNVYTGLDEQGYINMMLYQLGYASSFTPDRNILGSVPATKYSFSELAMDFGLKPGDICMYRDGNGENHYTIYICPMFSIRMTDYAGVVIDAAPTSDVYTTVYRLN